MAIDAKVSFLKQVEKSCEDMCTQCPLQEEICDELRVDMESVPSELLDRIEEELEHGQH